MLQGNGWYSHIATCYDCCPSHRPWRCWEAQLTNHENHRNRNIMWHNWHRFSETTTRALWQTHIFHQGGISTHHLGFRPSQSPPINFVPTGCCFCISAKVGSSTTGSSALWQVAAAVLTGTGHLWRGFPFNAIFLSQNNLEWLRPQKWKGPTVLEQREQLVN